MWILVPIAKIKKVMKKCIIHNWKINDTLSNGFTTYSECQRCGDRKAEQPFNATVY